MRLQWVDAILARELANGDPPTWDEARLLGHAVQGLFDSVEALLPNCARCMGHGELVTLRKVKDDKPPRETMIPCPQCGRLRAALTAVAAIGSASE